MTTDSVLQNMSNVLN
jgi:hypothetical protein